MGGDGDGKTNTVLLFMNDDRVCMARLFLLSWLLLVVLLTGGESYLLWGGGDAQRGDVKRVDNTSEDHQGNR